MLVDLEWLPPAPHGFRDRLRALQGELAGGIQPNFYERLVSLAATSLSEAELTRLAGLSSWINESDSRVDELHFVKLGIMGDGTLSLLGPPIVGSGFRHGLLIDVREGHYNSAVQEAADRSSHMHAAELDFVLIAGDARALGLDRAAASEGEADAKIDAAWSRLQMIVEGLRPSVKSAILVQTLPPPLDPLFGSFDRVYAGSPFAMVETLNRRIADWAGEGRVTLVDIARLATAVGLGTWHEPGHWHASKLAFSPRLIPIYSDVVARTIAAVVGKSKKCLVLDLDNTLWGGVIGDDGVGGIKLGQGSSAGEAFLAIQTMALELRSRGIILAVCSKNEEDVARLPFREHPDMLLREDHIAVFQANWTDKAANLRAIAGTLNIGMDALVFLDDNPAERMQVRAALPLVGVPELPADPALYPRAIAAAGYFEAVGFSKEDRLRAEYYQANAQRAHALSSSGDLGDYLASLDMVCAIGRVDPISRSRVAQLTNKSNQYNLTTRRYSEAEMEMTENDPSQHAIQIRLSDRFGDNGIISVIIANKTSEAWTIDTWLMSCRVLGRRVQEAALTHLAAAAASHGAKRLIGRYIPSARNRMVASHYQSLGFTLIDTASDGATEWRLHLADYMPPELPIRIEDSALARAEADARAFSA
jgi:FkbH-like protein